MLIAKALIIIPILGVIAGLAANQPAAALWAGVCALTQYELYVSYERNKKLTQRVDELRDELWDQQWGGNN